MGDDKAKNHNEAPKPKLWLGREIVKPEHEQDLERQAAIGEFDRKMPRGEAEEKAYQEYKKRQHLEAAVFHLQGMKAAHASGSMDDAHRHSVMYELHMKQLGHDGGNGPVPQDVQSLLGEQRQGPYKFSPHGADSFVLSQDHEMQKAERGHYPGNKTCSSSGCKSDAVVTYDHKPLCPRHFKESTDRPIGSRTSSGLSDLGGGGQTTPPREGHLKVVKAETHSKYLEQPDGGYGEDECYRDASGNIVPKKPAVTKAELAKIGGYNFTEEESGTPLRKETMCKQCKMEKCVCKREETPGEKHSPEETSSATTKKSEPCGVCGCRSCVCGEIHKAEVRAKVTSLLTVAAALLDLKKSQSK